MAKKAAKSRVNVLVVDDTRINRRLVVRLLDGLGFDLIEASSGREALRIAREQDIALMLLDVMMPGMDGFDVAERIRQDPATRNMPIIFITAVSKELHHVFKGYELGAVDYLIKPVEPEVLRGKVSIFVKMYTQRHNLEILTRELSETVHELEKSQVALTESERRYRTVADYNYDWEAWQDEEGKLVYVSPSCERLCGYAPERFLDDPDFLERIIYKEDRSSWDAFMLPEVSDDESLDMRIHHKNSRLRWVNAVKRYVSDEHGRPLGIRFSLRDITSRKYAEEQLRRQALHDPLTGVGNRTLCLDRISQGLERGRRDPNHLCALIFLDMDRFKIVNDSLGHTTGDKLLIEVSERLEQCLRRTDTIARFGGDEFILFLEGLDSPREMVRVVRRIQQSMRSPFVLDGVEIQTSVSIGIVMVNETYENAEDVIRDANIAMYRSKANGRDRFKTFSESMREQAAHVLVLENELRRGVAKREFYLHFQPIVQLGSGLVSGYEALVRWNHSQRGFVSPGEFIPVAEETGLILPLGDWVLRNALSSFRDFLDHCEHDTNGFSIAVNLSGRQFAKAELVEDVSSALRETGVPPEMLKLEITETVIMEDARGSASKLKRLRDLGLNLAIDDFGTGYSSMNYLQRFPLDVLKIDLSFVQRLDDGPENVEIVRAIINLAHSLRMHVVAEGIETISQRDMLESLRCDLGQGFFFSRPVPVDQAGPLLGTCLGPVEPEIEV